MEIWIIMAASPWGEFKRDVCGALEAALSKLDWKLPVGVEQTLEEPPDPKLGDLATRLCFELAKTLHKSPMWLAEELGKAIKPAGLIARVEVADSYVNFFVDVPKLTELTLRTIERAEVKYGCSKLGKG
ncbi:MAG: hypothetical protein OEX16_03680, partial [Hadesarchaea archaeon]|nr:hypothetical protein [Hadesarchaea archaeon]